MRPWWITRRALFAPTNCAQWLDCNAWSSSPTGSYSCLKVDLLFKREFSYYLIQIYIPCCMLVIVSWVSFWLDPNAIPARVSLGVTTLLTMATSISGINSSLPPVSYTKAIDVWTGVCLTFVFGALLEFALVNYASRSDAHRAALKQQQASFAQRKWDMEQATAVSMDANHDHVDHDRTNAFPMVSLHDQSLSIMFGELEWFSTLVPWSFTGIIHLMKWMPFYETGSSNQLDFWFLNKNVNTRGIVLWILEIQLFCRWGKA